MVELPKIILGVPGFWGNRNEFKEAMARNGNGYIYMGNHIGNLENPEEFFEVDMSNYNHYVAEAFEIAGNGSFSKEDINNLKKHKSIVYIIGEGGSLDKAIKIMEVASAVLHAGGTAVNVESSGRARTKNDWLDITSSKEITRVFTAFIQMSRENNTFYTTGMKSFGYPDVITTSEGLTGTEVEKLFKVFCLYNLIEKPNINDGETFSLDPKSPVYSLKQENCTMFEGDDPFYNPYGVWNLVRHHRPENE